MDTLSNETKKRSLYYSLTAAIKVSRVSFNTDNTDICSKSIIIWLLVGVTVSNHLSVLATPFYC